MLVAALSKEAMWLEVEAVRGALRVVVDPVAGGGGGEERPA